MTQYGFFFDSVRCVGCKTCEIACKDYNDLSFDIGLRRVYDMAAGSWSRNPSGSWSTDAITYYLSISCNHCENPACVANCPTGSMQKNPDTGLVYNDHDLCIGCGTCVRACPYGAPIVDESSHLSRKCSGCASRVEEGKRPICAEACIAEALAFGDIEELRASHESRAQIAPLPDPDQTAPSLVIDSATGVEGAYSAGEISNPREV